jgi:predicted ATPase
VIYLRSISLKSSPTLPDAFPFSVPVIRNLKSLDLTAPVTFLVGENGSGKSTLLEALAAAARSITVGTDNAETDGTLTEVRQLAERLKLVWTQRTRKGFFMRSEDFFGYTRRVAQIRVELQNDLERVNEEYQDRSDYARSLARMAYNRELAALKQYYGEGLDTNSHGESFFALFQARFVPGGLYLLDEPEAPLSPTRQLAFLSMIKTMLDQSAQFIIATHSPILLAYPGASILSFDGDSIHPVAYDELEHVTITRDFLTNPSQYLKHLLED